MNVLGLDTSTGATAVCVARADGEAFEHLPPASDLFAPPRHSRELMPAIDSSMRAAGLGFEQLDAIAVGIGPGGYTGLRIGVSTARALGQAARLAVRPVPSLAALAAGAEGPLVLAVIDARRGELFASLWAEGEQRWPAFVATPREVVERLRDELGNESRGPLAVGDGALRSREDLEAAGARVPADESPVHVVRALHVCRFAAGVPEASPAVVTPDYLRAPDAKPTR